jgi:alginate O-acetyltransferase complex protein AlgI
LYYAAKPKYRNFVLLAGSLVFYAYGEPVYICLMIFSIIVNHLFARRIYYYHTMDEELNANFEMERRVWLILAMVYNFGVLFLFKYLDFFIENLNHILGENKIKTLSLTLPLGISFYTFQMASYIIDVYRGRFEVSRNILHFATYVSMFPQLIAGPIVNYMEVREQLRCRKTDYRGIEWGVTLFLMGLTYKVLLANKIASLWNDVQTAGVYGIHTATAWLGSWGYSMQIFFDFFGYSLMAIGLGRIMGFNLPVNFINPYCAKSVTDFWRRWHVTLSRWFREYIYIPLGGNRKGTARQVLNLFVVWSLTGLWHGASWNFIIWGMFFFVLLVLEKFVLLKGLNRFPLLGRMYMLILIPVSWTIFNITDLSSLWQYLCRMFALPLIAAPIGDGWGQFIELLQTYWWLLLLCVVGCTPYPLKWIQRFYRTAPCKLILLALFWVCVYQMAKGGDNPFLYFRF